MSASLVGSEMCIRDREEPAETPIQVERAGAGACTVCRFPLPRPVPPRDCLLYTSDAADDM
eukprot:10713146-Alexandrium_andersonii.AAC.1